MKKIKLKGSSAFLAGVLLLTSCATQQEYKAAVDLAKHYQDQVLEKDLQFARSEAQNRKLRNELTTSQVMALEAGTGNPALEARLDELQRRLAGISSNPDGISRVNLDDGAYVYMVSEAVLFSSGSAEVNQDGRQALLEQVATDIRSATHGRIWVRGHTDSVPVARPATLKKFPHGNLQLSVARAIEVAAILTGPGGVSKDQVVVAGFGPTEPLTSNGTAEDRKMNRRVEIYVSPDK
jgi:chemotaxis protein MotB